MLACNVIPYTETRTSCYMVNRNDSQVSINFDNLYISFIADSGVSDHMVNGPSVLSNFTQGNETIRCANKSAAAIYVRTNADDNNHAAFMLAHVKYSSYVAKNLLSLGKFIECGFTPILNRKELKIIDPITDKVVIKGKYESPSWIVELPLVDPNTLNNEKIYITNFVTENNDQNLSDWGGAEAPEKEIEKDDSFENIKPSEDSTNEISIDETQVVNFKSI